MTAAARIQNLPKQPPHSIAAEQSVLGGLMLMNRIYTEIGDKLSSEDFYRTDHQLIYAGIAAMLGANKPCDFVTLSEHLRDQGRLDEAGGPKYLGDLAADTYSIANVVSYAEIVRERSVLRKLIAKGADIGDLGYRPDGRTADELIEHAERLIFELRAAREHSAGGLRPFTDFMTEAEGDIERLHKQERKLGGLSTGYASLDRKIDGLHAGDFVVLASRPGLGKTTLAVNIAANVATIEQKRALIFSMEMQGRQVALRVIAGLGRVPMQRLRGGALQDEDWGHAVGARAKARLDLIELDESGGLSPMDVRARSRRATARGNVGLIVVDYLQLMQIPGFRENRNNEVSKITRSLKTLAKELQVPIIALSQLTRESEKEDRRPRSSDLRDSGGIESDADVVLLIYRKKVGDSLATGVGAAEIIVGKQRQGSDGTIRLNYFGECCRFEQMSEQDEFDYREQQKATEPARGFKRLAGGSGKDAAAGDS